MGNLLTLLQSDKVRNVLTLGITPGLLHFIRLCTVNATGIGEEQKPMVSGGYKEVLPDIVGTQLRTLNTLAAAVLAAVVVTPSALNVPAPSNGKHHLFFRNEVFDTHVAIETKHDLSATVIAKAVNELLKLFGDNPTLLARGLQNMVICRDQSLEFVVLIDDLLTLERCQAAQLHVKDRARL